MDRPIRIGIIICDRYKDCAGGKCFRALRDRDGAFSRYDKREVEVVGYPPCPYVEHSRDFIEAQRGMDVVMGTHPIPEKYYSMHQELGTWKSSEWKMILDPTLCESLLLRHFQPAFANAVLAPLTPPI